MNKTLLQLLLFVLILSLFSACDDNGVFEKYQPISENGWHKDSLIVFSFPITDTLQNHKLKISVRNDIDYNYSNLWLFIEINQPGEIGITDTLEVLLADRAGKWFGEGFGGIKTRQVIYRGGVYFPVSGEYKINIQHGMCEELLNGITDIGFRVEKMD